MGGVVTCNNNGWLSDKKAQMRLISGSVSEMIFWVGLNQKRPRISGEGVRGGVDPLYFTVSVLYHQQQQLHLNYLLVVITTTR
ncbi:hypothetical protein An02g06930 [Aspergillus niger]|uniref:Uncharacterized protein n=2 Tax=Aspergillus niger TaxID=5061 RepID=A5AA85_ASPNC|nr:hypothetical protein An02g06930 [Aspergillus niger]CAK44237.1 hypothetical protein An02g06930 [Aspergillus niger]